MSTQDTVNHYQLCIHDTVGPCFYMTCGLRFFKKPYKLYIAPVLL